MVNIFASKLFLFYLSVTCHHTKILINCEHFSLIFINTYKPGIFPTTSLQPVNIIKNSNLNRAMKLTLIICFFSFSILFTYSLTTLWYKYLQAQILESCMYLSDQLFFKVSHETWKLQEKAKKNAFTSKL